MVSVHKWTNLHMSTICHVEKRIWLNIGEEEGLTAGIEHEL